MNHSLEKSPFNNQMSQEKLNNNQSSGPNIKYVPKPCFLNMKQNQIVNARDVDTQKSKFKSTNDSSIFVSDSKTKHDGTIRPMSRNFSDKKFKSAFNQNINLNNAASIDNYADTTIK